MVLHAVKAFLISIFLIILKGNLSAQNYNGKHISSTVLNLLDSSLKFDPSVQGYLCHINKKGDGIFISDGIVCGESTIGSFSDYYCFIGVNVDERNLKFFEAGKKLSYMNIISNSYEIDDFPKSIKKLSFSNYLFSEDSISCFIKQNIPLISDNRIWVEVTLFSKVVKDQLVLLLIFDKQNLSLKHIWRKRSNSIDNNPFFGCSKYELDMQVFKNYIFQNIKE